MIGIGVLLFVIWWPKEDSIEWHKREYLRAQQWGIVDDAMFEHGLAEWKAKHFARKGDRIDYHRRALIRLGYLQERAVVVYNHDADNVLSNVIVSIRTNKPGEMSDRFFSYKTDTNVIRFISVKRNAAIWEDLIRKADVSENGK